MKTHSITPTTPQYNWTLDLDSDGDPVLRIAGKIVIGVSSDGEELYVFDKTIKNLDLELLSNEGEHHDD